MSILHFSLRRLFRHWRVNMLVLIGISLASGLLAGLPSYASATASRSLRMSLTTETPSGRNIEIRGSDFALSGALYKEVTENIGDLIITRMDTRRASTDTDSNTPIVPIDEGERLNPQHITIWSFDKLRDYANLIEGNWPEYTEPHTQEEIQRAMREPPTVQAVIFMDTASRSGLRIGDQLVDRIGIKFLVVGIVDPVDRADDVWWGDPSVFKPVFRPGTNEDTIFYSVIINPLSMKNYFSGHDSSWRFVVDQEKINAENVAIIAENLINLKTQLEANRTQMLSNLPNILSEYRSNLATVRIVLLLLSFQAFVVILYTLSIIASFSLERTHSEISTLVGRGARGIQIALIVALENLVLSVFAGLILGPALAQGILAAWGWFSGESMPAFLPSEAWIFSMIGAGFGWVALTVPIVSTVYRGFIEWQRRVTRPAQLAHWQKLYLDVFLIVVGGVAYWQLGDAGSFIMHRLRETNLADPLLLLGPTILLVAIALGFLRIFPYLLRLFAWLSRANRGLVLSLSLTRLSRDPVRPSQIVLLVSLAVGLVLFASAFGDSLAVNQEEIAYYRVGADLRVNMGDIPVDVFENMTGVVYASPVVNTQIQSSTGKGMTLLAIDLDTFPNVARYPPGMTGITMDKVMQYLMWDDTLSEQEGESKPQNPYFGATNPDDPFPALFSPQALPAGKYIGDQLQLTLLPRQILFTIRGIVRDFPLVSGAYMLADQSAIRSVIDLDESRFYPSREAWLVVDPDFYPTLVQDPFIKGIILADAREELQSLQNNAFSQGAERAFELNALILVVLSVVGFFLIQFLTARQRTYEFGVLRASGLSAGQLLRILAGEGCLVMVMGMFTGTGIGLGLIYIMRSYLNLALSRALPGMVIYSVVIDLKSIASLYFVLILFYSVAILLALVALLKAGVHRVLRIGDE